MDYSLHSLIGSLGAGLVVLAYWALQTGKLNPERGAYSLLNALGSAFILYSLYFEFNLAAFLIEFFWLVISLYGIVKCIRSNRRIRH